MRLLILVFIFACVASLGLGAVTDSDVLSRDGIAKRTSMLARAGQDSGTTVVIATGALTSDGRSFMVIDTESDGASDTLSTINVCASVGKYDGTVDGDILVLASEVSSQDITIDETGNIDNQGVTVKLNDTGSRVAYQYDGTLTKWQLISYSDLLVLPVTNATVVTVNKSIALKISGTTYYIKAHTDE